MTGSIWQPLGIDPTDDQKAIKRAYARKLKVTNPEDDPEGFQTLRAAFDRAIAGVDAEVPHTVVQSWPKPKGHDEASPPEPSPKPAPEPNPRQVHASLMATLETLLRQPGPNDSAIVAAYRAVVHSPATDLIDVYAATEDWLLEVISNYIPQSDSLITPAIKHYRWKDHELRQREAYLVQRLLQRQHDLGFLTHIRSPRSEFHEAYAILSAPSPAITPDQLSWSNDIAKLLELVRNRYPSIVIDLDAATVALWQAHLGIPMPQKEATTEERQAHATLEARLEALLRQDHPDRDALMAAYQSVISSPANDRIGISDQTEEWLMWLIAHHIPNADPLIDPAVNHYRWFGRDVRLRGANLVQAILARQSDIAFLERIRKTSSDHHRAYKILSAPPQPFSLWRKIFPAAAASEVVELLELIRQRYPGVIQDLDSETVAHWDAYLAAPRPGRWGRLHLVLAPFCAAIAAWGLGAVPWELRPLFVPLLLPPVFAAISVIVAYGFKLPRRLWVERGNAAPAWLRYGWGPAVLGLLALAAAPPSPWLKATMALLCAIVAGWVYATGRAETGQGLKRQRLRAIGSEVYLVMWGVIGSTVEAPAHSLQICLALFSAAWVSACGRLPLSDLWRSLPKGERLVCSGSVLGLVITTATLALMVAGLDQGGRGTLWAAGLFAAVAAVTLLSRPLPQPLGPWVPWVKGFTALVAILIAAILDLDSLFLPLAAFLLLWAAVPTVMALVKDLKSKA